MSNKVVSYFRNQKRKTGDSGSNHGQFQRAENRKSDNYSLNIK